MRSKREILQEIGRNDLINIINFFELEVEDKRVKSCLVDKLSRARRAPIGEILEKLSGAALKKLCSDFDLPTSGSKAQRIERLTGNDSEASSPAKRQDTAIKRAPRAPTKAPISPTQMNRGQKERPVQAAPSPITEFPTMTPSFDPPSDGQLVQVRNRRYVVTKIAKSDLPTDQSSPGNGKHRQHLVSLSSVEDDGLGEELQVIWEIEPGARIYERASLPEVRGFDDPRRLDAFLDAVRWGSVASADHKALHAPFRSGITIEDYQLDPVVRALQMPRVNLLIADDVGLGKTIESGLVMQELLLRHRARSVLVVCPAGLQIHWQEQMRDKFGLEFRIVDSPMMRQLRRRRGLFVNPWTHFPRLITSIDFLKRERPMRLFREVLPAEGESVYPRRFDLLIVDEAHNVAPSNSGRIAVDSLRTQAIRTLARHFEHKLFLSATPHNGDWECWTALLELIDDQRFHRGTPYDEKQLRAVMVRRLKTELKNDLDMAYFKGRKLDALVVDYSGKERGAYADLLEYTKLRRQQATDATERCATEFVLKLLKKRLFSAPAAFLSTLEKHQESMARTRKKTRKGKKASTPIGVLQRHISGIDEDYADDEVYEDATHEVVDSATRLFRPLSAREEKLLGSMHAWAKQAAGGADSKARCLLDWLHKTLKPEGDWNDERVIIFTEYRATQNWLHGILAAEGLAGNDLAGGDRLMTIYGGMPSDEREAIKAAFQARPADSAIRILLATDAASEGIDLQNHCHRLVHYEIPWNPNRMEQRNGRVDRHGQQHTSLIYHFVGRDFDKVRAPRETKPGDLEGDLEFLMVAATKVNQIREDLGSVGQVIASQVEEAMRGKRNKLDTQHAEQDAAPARRLLSMERKLREEIERLHRQLRESREELQLSPQRIQTVVEVGLALAGQPPLREARVDGIWPDPAGLRLRCPAFHLPPLSGSWASCGEGLAHPHTREIRPIVFEHGLIGHRDDIVLAHLNHRLVQMCLRLLRAEVWSPDEHKNLHRATARVVASGALDAPAVVAFGRVVVLGGDSTRLQEELIVAGGSISKGKFSGLNVGQTQQAIQGITGQRPGVDVEKRLLEMWPELRDPLFRALGERMDSHKKSREKLLVARATKESSDIEAVLTELKENLEAELRKEAPVQRDLFSEPEKVQHERDRKALYDRVAAIPEEIEQETQAIARRYAKLTARLFPVAVSFLVPQHLAGKEVN